MKDPIRLVDNDELARVLLGSASEDVPPEEGRTRARQAALAATVAGVSAGASLGVITGGAKAATKAASWVVLKWVALAGMPLVVATASYVALRHDRSAPVASSTSVPTQALPQSTRPQVAETMPTSVPSAPNPATGAPVTSAQNELLGHKPNEQAAPHSSARSLQAEIIQFDTARLALAHGDGSALDRYLASYPKGALREQALWLKISSLEQEGRKAEATVLAKRFVSAYPNGAFAARARAIATR